MSHNSNVKHIKTKKLKKKRKDKSNHLTSEALQIRNLLP